MHFVRLGQSGLKISALSYGTALTIGTEDLTGAFARQMIEKAWDLGIRSFDTSNNYGMGKAESLLGDALSRYDRQEYTLSTKGSWPIGQSPYHRGLSRKHIVWALEESLKRLKLEYIDIYYAHRYDDETPMEEIVRTFNRLINQGLIRYWATSEWPVAALEKCLQICRALNLEAPITEQFIYSYAVHKVETNGVKVFCENNGLGMMGFSPLAQGLLTGKYRNNIPSDSRIAKSNLLNYDKTAAIYDQNKDKINFFVDLCSKFGVKGNHAALQWCLRQGVYPVIGASSPAQLEDNVNALKEENAITEYFWAELENNPRITSRD
ncbi:MAG: aldo/keto reductase [Deltaproteobacteria bacterium]|jgi:aryl-alcohol dehydrogenase-like predicted oxidoreductase|nr:aldo/keto reductase [Deltaproteobacteria bacterium]